MDTLGNFASRVFEDPIGRWIILALIIVIGLALALYYARNGLKAVISRLDAVKDQVQNDHADKPGVKANLREDLDEKHEVQGQKLDRILELTLSNTQAISGITGQISSLMGRIDNVELTQERYEHE